ncbi:hypothetical protein R2R35_04285 [Anaerocolumna sp. AGMB13020]|uniref:hypothetical protein n=1 Tax=Anaerocolumna sp. AGMB13020 TaxID=3081750 RepID=UPI002952A81C|nr:hypothetical protein [Anaerocolumna sp. AGMB13020]WOO37722.1 hypothetical protein R2R35_04285 [Anaerocolumna sp. AGMB13020]
MFDKVSKVGAFLFVIGLISLALSFVGLQFKFLFFLGEYRRTVEIASIVIGVILLLIAKVFGNNNNENE